MVNGRTDELVEHYVRRARDDGHSWTGVGHRSNAMALPATGYVPSLRSSTTRWRVWRCNPDGFEARCRLEHATTLARRAGQNHVGTEYLLVALLLNPGSRGRRVLQRLDTDFAAIERDLDQCLAPKCVPRRRQRRQVTMGCGFCSRQRRDGVPLVAGPGICICEHCTRLAVDTIADDHPGDTCAWLADDQQRWLRWSIPDARLVRPT